MSGKKIWSTIVDYFLILSSIIGVGFASGKEICIFFFDFGKMSLFGLLAFCLLYIYLFFIVDYVSKKLKLNSYNQFNTYIFGKLCYLSKIVMIINFIIACAGMLAGADYLFNTFFNVSYRIPSIILSIITLLLMLGGINKIKVVANVIIPIMIASIVINMIGNISPSNVHFDIVGHSSQMAMYYGLLFGVNNFIAALPMLFQTKLKTKGKLAVIATICVIILGNILIMASNKFSTSMPMFELSANISTTFYYIYFVTLVFAIFSTLMISSYNVYYLLTSKKDVILALLIVVFNFSISSFGYNFIVKYLYLVSSIISAVYVIILIIMIIIRLLNYKHKQKDINKK